MEKVIACSTWSLSWPPPEFEKAKRALLACIRMAKSCVRMVWVVLFVAPPGQEQIENARLRARQNYLHLHM
jgi:hypothetical protein